jgi:tetraprenyl-beta-curcumene synthase
MREHRRRAITGPMGRPGTGAVGRRGRGSGPPIRLSRRQVSAVLSAGGRELAWGLPATSKEIAGWRGRASRIPDECLRAQALRGLDHRRGHIDGAVLLSTLPARRSIDLLRALVAYEVMQDYLDGVSEQGARVGVEAPTSLFDAVGDALDPVSPTRGDYYAQLPWRDDGGYLAALVSTCRANVARLPSFGAVRELLRRESARTGVLWLNHVCDPARRDEALRDWTSRALPNRAGLPWHEQAAAGSGWITTLVLLALAAEPDLGVQDATTAHEAYFPYVALSLTLLDSWADQDVDAAVGDHNYVAHYSTREEAARRLCTSIERAAATVLRLPRGDRHAVVLACMIALYTTERSARKPALKPMTGDVIRSGGSLTRLLVPVMLLWRLRTFRYGATQ